MAFCSHSRYSFESDGNKPANQDNLATQDASVQHLMSYYQCRHYGWIKKQGGNHKNWKTRFMILCQGCLYYYENEQSVKPKGHVVLNNYRACPAPEMRKMPWVFKLLHLHPCMRTYYVSCKNRDEMLRWIEMIGKDIEVYCSSDDWGHGYEKYDEESNPENQRRNYFQESEIPVNINDNPPTATESSDMINFNYDQQIDGIIKSKDFFHEYQVAHHSSLKPWQTTIIPPTVSGRALFNSRRQNFHKYHYAKYGKILTVGTEDVPLHFRILYFSDKGWTLDRSCWFERLDQLIRYYHHNSLPNCLCKLTRAYSS
ncbi:RAC family serine/threonine-protein kinase-like protein [Trichoplax sp. H2]|nr:RAC family serine/threonine-protein kinase-like protein [Trichoplax sp. H2]|eukprot:RDD40541.1 RAC family serine/threonine-protein kinase-like protein [Trichoplax sp. H2]